MRQSKRDMEEVERKACRYHAAGVTARTDVGCEGIFEEAYVVVRVRTELGLFYKSFCI